VLSLSYSLALSLSGNEQQRLIALLHVFKEKWKTTPRIAKKTKQKYDANDINVNSYQRKNRRVHTVIELFYRTVRTVETPQGVGTEVF